MRSLAAAVSFTYDAGATITLAHGLYGHRFSFDGRSRSGGFADRLRDGTVEPGGRRPGRKSGGAPSRRRQRGHRQGHRRRQRQGRHAHAGCRQPDAGQLSSRISCQSQLQFALGGVRWAGVGAVGCGQCTRDFDSGRVCGGGGSISFSARIPGVHVDREPTLRGRSIVLHAGPYVDSPLRACPNNYIACGVFEKLGPGLVERLTR